MTSSIVLLLPLIGHNTLFIWYRISLYQLGTITKVIHRNTNHLVKLNHLRFRVLIIFGKLPISAYFWSCHKVQFSQESESNVPLNLMPGIHMVAGSFEFSNFQLSIAVNCLPFYISIKPVIRVADSRSLKYGIFNSSSHFLV